MRKLCRYTGYAWRLRKRAARAAGTTPRFEFELRYAGNDSLDAEFVSRVTKKLDGFREVSSQEFSTRKTSEQKGIGGIVGRIGEKDRGRGRTRALVATGFANCY